MSAILVLLKSLWDAVSGFVMMIAQLIETLTASLLNALSIPLGSRGPKAKRRLLAALSILVIVGSLFSMVYRPRPKINLKPFAAMGEVAAEETQKMLGGRGTIVVVSMDSGSQFSAMTVPIEAFQRAIRHQSGMSLVGTETVQIGPRPMMGVGMSLLPTDRFLAILEKYPHVDAIVSFVGAPALKDTDRDRLPKRLPKILAVSTFGPMLGMAIDSQIVTAAIVPRMQPQGTNSVPASGREWFDKYYQVVTPSSPDPGSAGKLHRHVSADVVDG